MSCPPSIAHAKKRLQQPAIEEEDEEIQEEEEELQEEEEERQEEEETQQSVERVYISLPGLSIQVANGPISDFWETLKNYFKEPTEDTLTLIQLQQFISVDKLDFRNFQSLLRKLKQQYEDKWPSTKQGKRGAPKRKKHSVSKLTCSKCHKVRIVPKLIQHGIPNEGEWTCSENPDLLYSHCSAPQECDRKRKSFVQIFSQSFKIDESKLRKWMGKYFVHNSLIFVGTFTTKKSPRKSKLASTVQCMNLLLVINLLSLTAPNEAPSSQLSHRLIRKLAQSSSTSIQSSNLHWNPANPNGSVNHLETHLQTIADQFHSESDIVTAAIEMLEKYRVSQTGLLFLYLLIVVKC